MSLVFAAFTPHPPLLLPSIGKEQSNKLEKTKEAFEKLNEDFYLAKPDIAIIISPHGNLYKDAFTLNVSPEVETDLRDFGDLTTKLKFKTDIALSSRIYERVEKNNIPVSMINDEKLDHGASIPLYHLSAHVPNLKVLPIGFCDLDWKNHLEFGSALKSEIAESNKRIAVIASGDLSHALTSDSPAGFNASGIEFDKKIQEYLAEKNASGMLQMDKKFVEDASECGFKSLLILQGILRDVDYEYKKYSYEAPFGVGYLVSNFIL